MLVEAGYRVIAPDLRGFGGTDKPQANACVNTSSFLGDNLSIQMSPFNSSSKTVVA